MKVMKIARSIVLDFQAFEIFMPTHGNSYEFPSFAYQGANAVGKLLRIFSLTEKPRVSKAYERTSNLKIASL